MLSYKDLLNLIKESDFTLVGYTFKSERIKDEFISNFSYIEIEEIDSSFSFKQFIRDYKIKIIKNRFGNSGDEILYNSQENLSY